MLICKIDEKKDKVKIRVEGSTVEVIQDLSIELKALLNNGIPPEFITAAIVHAVNDNMKQDDFNESFTVISNLLKAIKDK